MTRGNRPALEPDRIVRAALDLLDEVGIEEFSMRRLAEALGVQNPALYWHVENKQELFDRMAQVLLAEGFAAFDAGRPEPRVWTKRLERFARALRDSMRRRRDGARLVAAANLLRPESVLLGRIEALVIALVAAGFRARDALGGVLTIIHYTLGTTFEERSDPRGGDPALPDDLSLPTLAALARSHDMRSPSQVDARFDLGVQLIVDGLGARLRRRRPGKG